MNETAPTPVDPVADALRLLTQRYGTPLPTVGPSIEAVASAAARSTAPTPAGAGLGPPVPPTDDELAAALRLLPRYRGDVDAAERALISYARAIGEPGQPARLTYEQIGLLLGYQPDSAKQRARQLALKHGLVPNPVSRGSES